MRCTHHTSTFPLLLPGKQENILYETLHTYIMHINMYKQSLVCKNVSLVLRHSGVITCPIMHTANVPESLHVVQPYYCGNNLIKVCAVFVPPVECQAAREPARVQSCQVMNLS